MILISQLISAILQVVILTAIPFIFYLFKEKRAKGFFEWMCDLFANETLPKGKQVSGTDK